jgi:hypothetical protein
MPLAAAKSSAVRPVLRNSNDLHDESTRFAFSPCPRRESNPDLRFRKPNISLGETAKIVAVCVRCVIRDGMPQRTTWEIYEIQHCRGPGYPVRKRYQFVDGHGQRRHFSTKARARLERDKARALFTQEGKLAAGMDEPHRRDAAQAIGLLPAGWTLTRCVQFVADHLKRTTQVLSIEKALDRFLTTKEKTSDYHSNDLARRLKRWAETRESPPTDSRGDQAGS